MAKRLGFPEQRQGCEALWRAVLTQAIEEYGVDPFPPKNLYFAEQAERWLFREADRSEVVGSFEWVCETLSCDPDRLRTGLRRQRKGRGENHEAGAYHPGRQGERFAPTVTSIVPFRNVGGLVSDEEEVRR